MCWLLKYAHLSEVEPLLPASVHSLDRVTCYPAMILYHAWGYLQHFREKPFWHFFLFYSLKNNVLVWWPNYDTVIHLIYTFAEQAGSWWDPLSFDCNNLESLPYFGRQYWQSQQVIISVIMISRLVMRPLILSDIVFSRIVPLNAAISFSREEVIVFP